MIASEWASAGQETEKTIGFQETGSLPPETGGAKKFLYSKFSSEGEKL
ncbi:MAG: hypothetical protein ACI3XT_06890 [Butyricicoccaceae bacterium]